MARKWVKVTGSDVRLEWPMKQIMDPDGEHWHYAEDKSQPPEKRRIPARILEDNGDGTYTSWAPTLWGPVGSTGQLRPEVHVEPVTLKRDMEQVRALEKSLDDSLKTQTVLFECMRYQRDLKLERAKGK